MLIKQSVISGSYKMQLFENTEITSKLIHYPFSFFYETPFQCWYKSDSFTGENLEPAVFIK